MRRRALTLAAVLLAAAAAAPLAAAAQSRAPAESAVPPIPYKERTLANGMKVVSVRDATTPNVTVQVWYDVGSKDDPQGRSGFAHLFEHLLFKATRNLPAESIDRLTEDVGGFNNAFTADDVTAYYEVIPAHHLERLLWAEAERMGSLVIDRPTFLSERDVVKEEYRQSYLANPYGRLSLLLDQESFSVHPYKRSTIGNLEELDAATVEDVLAFHATYYRPDNAVLIVVGNFDEAELNRWVDKYFAPLKRPQRPIPRVNVKEPVRTAARVVDGYGANVPLPAVAVSYQSVAAGDPDAPIVDVLDAVLSAGESSRLYRSLVYEQQVATSASVRNNQAEEAGYFVPTAIAAGGKTLEQVEAALLKEIARVREQPITAAELAEAKAEVLAQALRERETIDGRAQALGEAIIATGDARNADRYLQRLQAVTAADVQRVARTLLADNRKVTIRYRDQSQRPAGTTEASAPKPPATTELARTTPVTVVTAAAPGERVQPPPLAQPRTAATPRPVERTLANGLRVIVAPAGQLPLVAARLQVAAGAADDPKAAPGTARMTAELLTQGAGKRSAAEIATAVEQLGAELSAGAGWDGTAVALNVLDSRLDAAMAIMADVAIRPTFAGEELERQRAQALDALKVSLSQPGGVLGLISPKVAFGEGPYGHPQAGTETSLTALTAADLKRFHGERFSPANATLVLTGKLTPEQGFALAEKHFGGWRAAPGAATRTGDVTVSNTPARTVVVDLPGAGQASVAAVRPTLPRTAPDYVPTQVASAVLGGGFSARLNQEIRIRRGLSYGAFAGLSARRQAGVLSAQTQTKNESAAEVADILTAQLAGLASQPLEAAELTARKSSLTGGYGRDIETVDGLATELGNLAAYGLPLSELAAYPGKVEAVTSDAARAAAAKWLAPDAASLIVVGDAKAFSAALKAKRPDAVVIPIGELDPGAPSLRKAPAR